MADDVPHLPKTVSWAEPRASIEARRAERARLKLDPDEVTPYLKIQAAIVAEKAKRRGR